MDKSKETMKEHERTEGKFVGNFDDFVVVDEGNKKSEKKGSIY